MSVPQPPPEPPSWTSLFDVATPAAPPPATDPTNLLDVLRLQSDAGIEEANAQLAEAEQGLAAGGGGGGGGMGGGFGFRIDPDAAEPVIAQLDEIVVNLRMAAQGMHVSAIFSPPGPDEVSLQLARNGAELARRAETYFFEHARQIEETATALRAELRSYRAADDSHGFKA